MALRWGRVETTERCMNMFELAVLNDENASVFKRDMQEAFELGAEAYFGTGYGEVLPEKDVNESLDKANSVAYAAWLDDQLIGGAIVSLAPEEMHGELEFLYVKAGIQGKGIGASIWRKIEQLHPEVEVWETVTPYFDRRNVYFYLNVCGFHAVEFLRDEEMPEDGNMVNAANEADMLRFEKRMTE